MTKYSLLIIVLLPILVSCVNTRKATYFNDLANEEIDYKVESLEPVIQKNDLLSISVNSTNHEATQLFNLASTATSQGNEVSGNILQFSGYLVDQDGNIQFPMLGDIKAAGLTKKELKEAIQNQIVQKNLLYNPVINIKYLNYKVTVIGEVNHPTVINVPNEKITLLEAIGLAGDLTLFARRDNVLVIHEVEGKRISHRLNLNDKELFTSPYYYLNSHDVVYVGPNKTRVASTSRGNFWIPTAVTALSIATIIVDRLTR